MGKKRIELVFIISMVLAMLRTIVVVTNIKKSNYQDNVYYVANNTLTNIFNVLFFISFVAVMVFAVLAGIKQKAQLDNKNNITSAASWSLSFILFGSAIINLVDNISGRAQGGSFNSLMLALAIATGVFILLKEIKSFNEKTLSLLTLIPVAFTAVRLLEDFMNSNAAPLANSGAFNISGLAILLLYFLCEGKAFINKGSAILFYLFGYTSVVLLLVYSIPDLFLHCSGVFDFNYHSALSMVNILTALYVLSRLSSAELIYLPQKTED